MAEQTRERHRGERPQHRARLQKFPHKPSLETRAEATGKGNDKTCTRRPEPVPFSPASFATRLVEWFERSQRDLRWRQAHNATDPYRILVSEVMLQQTTVAAVGPFYERFLNRFPDARTLAGADESDVLACWAGLGYYARARNLHKAAKAIQTLHGGQFPVELEAILELPGVGRYTAGAVASIAFNARAPIVDANVARVLSRVLAVEGDLKTSANQARLWEAATRVVEVENVEPREVNPAMMELGALICTPKNPRCALCPVAHECEAKRQNRQNELPHISPKKALTPMFDVCALALDDQGRVLLRRRPDDAKIWWRGMWELPRTTRTATESSEGALERLGQELAIRFAPQTCAAMVKHGVTRYSIELECWRVAATNVEESDNLKWVGAHEAHLLAMPSMMRRLFERFAPASANGEQSLLMFD